MSHSAVERVADALLFEGYMLYPYRPSAVKNRQRFNFGVVYPQSSEARDIEGADASRMRTVCLLEGDQNVRLTVKVRFLQLVQRTLGALSRPASDAERLADHVPVDVLRVDDRTLQPWQEAVERAMVVQDVTVAALCAQPLRMPFAFPAAETLEAVHDAAGGLAGVIVRRQRDIDAEVTLAATELSSGLHRISAQIDNVSPPDPARDGGRDELLLRSLVSAHTILSAPGGSFISLLDPPETHAEHVAGCHAVRSWPVLVGASGQRDTMLSSPIIIYDYPLIAPESAGDLFDGTEIDEILSLRILTMTDAEKSEMRQTDERARLLLERTESLDAESLMRMHGVMRAVSPLAVEHA